LRRTWTFGFGTLLTLLLSLAASAGELGTLRVGVLAFGTVNWELDVIRHHGLDAEQGFTLDVQEFGGGDATNVALLGGAVDTIVDDWLWVSRQRAEGLPLTFVPFSRSVGAVMVEADGGITTRSTIRRWARCGYCW
jgi:NitT/TauT family transport system substrate-binding protein